MKLINKLAVLSVFIFVFVTACGFLSGAFAFSNSYWINRIENRYKKVNSISAFFYQKEVMPGYSTNLLVQGYFYYRSPDGMAWIYTHPFRKRQILKGDSLYIIDPALKKVIIVNVNKKNGGFPPDIIEVMGNITRYFNVEKVSEIRIKNLLKIYLKPIRLQRAKTIEVELNLNNLKIISLKIITYQGQEISFIYKNVKFNGQINGSVFDTNFSADYKIIKERY